jgi:hypothetical protein
MLRNKAKISNPTFFLSIYKNEFGRLSNFKVKRHSKELRHGSPPQGGGHGQADRVKK